MNKTNNSFSSTNGEKIYQGNFKLANHDIEISKDSFVFAFSGSNLLLVNEQIPNFEQFKKLNIAYSFCRHIGMLSTSICHALEIGTFDENIKEVSLIGLREAYNHLTDDNLKAAIYSYQIVVWNKRTQFCGACGTRTREPEGPDWVKECPNCKENYYPKISPAIIVAINNNGKLLMAQHSRFTKKLFTILAGFVNPGESLEECLHREVKEEANIEVENIRYFGSEPWPFPDSLMIGFKADYKAGDLKPDMEEIIELKWFKPNEIPVWGLRSSITRRLINDFIEENS